jgi:hypothetical protein
MIDAAERGHSSWQLLQDQIRRISATRGTNDTKKKMGERSLQIWFTLLCFLCFLWPIRLWRFPTSFICEEIAS